MPALFVIGLQEMVDLSAGNVVLDAVNDSQSREQLEGWVAITRGALDTIADLRAKLGGAHAPPASFELVASHHLCGVAIMLFADASLRPHVHAVQAKAVATGNLGLGNKARAHAVCRRRARAV